MSCDQLLERVDGSTFQLRMFLFFFFNGLPMGLVAGSLVFMFYVPEFYRCAFPFLIESFINNTSSAANSTLHELLPIDSETMKLDKCNHYNITVKYDNASVPNIASDVLSISNKTVACSNGFIFNTSATYGFDSAPIQFGWICDKATLKPVLTSCYMMGVGVGSFSGLISDRFGRRKIFLASSFIQFICTFIQSFISSAELFGIGLFLSGLFGMICYLTAFVMATELLVPKRRNFLSISSFFSFAVGFSLSSLFAYLTRGWVWLLRSIALFGILYLANLRYTLESPRWLATNGRTKEVKKIFDVIAKCNNKPLISLNEIQSVTESTMEDEKKVKQNKKQKFQVFKDVFKTPIMLAIVFVTVFSWFSVALVYYGISLSVQALNGNIYVNIVLMGLVDIPGLIIAFYTVKYLNRPFSHGGMMALSGVFCMGAALLNQVNEVVSAVAGLIGKALNAGTFYIIYIHTAEIFPTLARSTFVCLGSLGGRFGSVSSSYVSYLADIYGIFVPYVIMSSCALLSGVLIVIFLPETRLKELPESVADTIRLKSLFSSVFGERLESGKENERLTQAEETQENLLS